MMGPISTTGRAAQASIEQKMGGGMPPDQAVAYTEQLLLDNISPDLETMMAQAQQLRQMQQKPPQMTIRDQLNQAYQGIAQLPTPGFQPGFAGGGIVGDAVAFAGGGPSQLTPQQIALQMQRQARAQASMGLGNYGIGLENYPDFIEDVPTKERIISQVVDDKGNVWHQLENGEWRQATGKRLAGATVEGNRLIYPDRPTPMQREISNYSSPRSTVPDVTVDRISGRTIDRRVPTGEGIKSGTAPSAAPSATAAEATAAKEAGLLRRGLGALTRNVAPIAAVGGMGAMIGDVGERAESQRGEGAETGPVILNEFNPMGMAYSTETAPKLGDIGDMFSSLFSGATLGLFGDRETERAAERKKETKPAEAPKPAPKPDTKPADVAGNVVAATRQGIFDIPIAIESARASLESAVTEDGEYKKLLERAKKEGTGPFSKMFTEGDRIKAERLEDLKKRKESNFGRALVAAGLAMAEQASKGGQPGNEVQKFLASAVAGLGGYMKAQTYLQEELDKSQKEVDKFTLDMEQLREASRGELRGSALKRFNDAQARAEKARDNVIGLVTVRAQLEYAGNAAQMRAATTLQAGRERAQAQLYGKAQQEVMQSPAYLQAQLEHARAKTDAERNAATAKMSNLIQQQAQMNMQNPAYMAGINYNLGSGDLDFSAVDAIVNKALGTGQ